MLRGARWMPCSGTVVPHDRTYRFCFDGVNGARHGQVLREVPRHDAGDVCSAPWGKRCAS